MAKSPKTFTSHSPLRAPTLSGPASRRRWTRELLQTRNRAFGPNGGPTTSRQTSVTRTDTTSRLPTSLGSTNKTHEPSTRPTDTGRLEQRSTIMKRLDNKVAIVTGASKAMVNEMLKQGSGCVITISAALADNPIAGVNASVPMITKGGLNTVTRHLAIEYAKQGIRFNAVAPGVVDTSLHQEDPKDHLHTPRSIVEISDIADAVLYLANAGQVTGEVLHVVGGAHGDRW